MTKKIINLFLFFILIENFYSLKISSSFEVQKDLDDKESLVNIQFFNIEQNLIKNHLDIKAKLIRQEPCNRTALKLALPFKLGNKNIFMGVKGLNSKYFLTLDNLSLTTDIKIYIRTLFEYENIRYGFECSLAYYDDNKLQFAFVKPYFKYSYKSEEFKSIINFRIAVEEYYQTEKSFSYLKSIFYNNSDKINFSEKLQNLEMLFKIKNKDYRKISLNIFSKQKYNLLKELSIGLEEKFNYIIRNNHSISNISIKLSPFIKLQYKLSKNLSLSHKFKILFTHGFSTFNNSISVFFDNKLSYRF